MRSGCQDEKCEGKNHSMKAIKFHQWLSFIFSTLYLMHKISQWEFYRDNAMSSILRKIGYQPSIPPRVVILNDRDSQKRVCERGEKECIPQNHLHRLRRQLHRTRTHQKRLQHVFLLHVPLDAAASDTDACVLLSEFMSVSQVRDDFDAVQSCVFR